MHPAAIEILDFWFGPADDPGHGQPRPAWFKKDAGFDAEISQRFGALIEAALLADDSDTSRDWIDPPLQALPALARLLLLDQFTRNIYRGTPRSFAGDGQALQIAQALVDSGRDRDLNGAQRGFVYLPFEHAEDLSHQRRSVQLFQQLALAEPAQASLVDWAQRHHDIVARFGRFPHRNEVLGRTSTVEELAFLQTPGSGF